MPLDRRSFVSAAIDLGWDHDRIQGALKRYQSKRPSIQRPQQPQTSTTQDIEGLQNIKRQLSKNVLGAKAYAATPQQEQRLQQFKQGDLQKQQPNLLKEAVNRPKQGITELLSSIGGIYSNPYLKKLAAERQGKPLGKSPFQRAEILGGEAIEEGAYWPARKGIAGINDIFLTDEEQLSRDEFMKGSWGPDTMDEDPDKYQYPAGYKIGQEHGERKEGRNQLAELLKQYPERIPYYEKEGVENQSFLPYLIPDIIEMLLGRK